MENIYTNIPTWDNGTWTTTTFDSRKDFGDYIKSIFRYRKL